jgi:hypothetical protein
MKPRERRKEKEQCRKSRRLSAKPMHGKQVDENYRSAACRDAEKYQRKIGIVSEMPEQSTAAYVKKVTRRVGLVNAWIKARHAEGEVHRVKIVGFMAPKGISRASYGQGEARGV